MKRNTQSKFYPQIVFCFGIFFIILSIIFLIILPFRKLFNFFQEEIIFFIILSSLSLILGVVLIIISKSKWYFQLCDKFENERQELRKAQLQALRKGNVNVELKGKMRKVK